MKRPSKLYTAIYFSTTWDSWDDRPAHEAKMRHIELQEGETIKDMLHREGLTDTINFIFKGHLWRVAHG